MEKPTPNTQNATEQTELKVNQVQKGKEEKKKEKDPKVMNDMFKKEIEGDFLKLAKEMHSQVEQSPDQIRRDLINQKIEREKQMQKEMIEKQQEKDEQKEKNVQKDGEEKKVKLIRRNLSNQTKNQEYKHIKFPMLLLYKPSMKKKQKM